jgi:Crp-like helix-turn-helix domain
MYSRVSFNRCIVQLEGHMVRCPIELLQHEFKNSEHVRDLFVSYSETLLSQVQQTVACNSMHTTEERMCRWLLMMHDRAGGEALPYTHEFLSHILGANRKSVTLAAQAMQTAGLISYPPEFPNSTVQYQRIICVISALHRKVENLHRKQGGFHWESSQRRPLTRGDSTRSV